MKAKKKIFQAFYQASRRGGNMRGQVEHALTAQELRELDDELSNYVCLSSRVQERDPFTGEVLRLVYRDYPAEKKNSAITKCCFVVSEPHIKRFFRNRGLRAAWNAISPAIRAAKPGFDEIFDYIE